MRRKLFCFNCYGQKQHSVLRKHLYANEDGKHRVVASAICAKCETEQTIDVSVSDWHALLENKKWGI